MILKVFSKACFSNVSQLGECKSDSFKSSRYNSALKIYSKFRETNKRMHDLKAVFSKIENDILVIDYKEFNNMSNICRDTYNIIRFC